MARPIIQFAKCGTPEIWERQKHNYNVHKVIPATLYICETGICVVTSQEWADWMLGRTDKIPEGE